MPFSGKTGYYFTLIPMVGIGVFVLLYAVAAWLYPGGSYADMEAEGFSMAHNYWCELMDPYAKNGEWNRGRPIAISGMAVLCLSLAVLWYCLPVVFRVDGIGRWVIRCAGAGSMVLAMFVFTSLHDAVIYGAGLLGFVAFGFALVLLWRREARALFWTGSVALASCAVCYVIFRTGWFESALPVFQKLAFVLCLVWFGLVGRVVHGVTGAGRLKSP